MRIALYQPDIPQNAGTILRLGACLGIAVDIIEPCGFPLSHASLRRAGMDYLDHVDMTRHADFDAFQAAQSEAGCRIVLLTTRADVPHTRFAFSPDDTLLLGRESAGVPDDVHARADSAVTIPMRPGLRSINVAMAAAIVAGEAARQTGLFPAA
ncbi:tRNA (cytidine(34)-2'-O)-methyltransferase [Tepidamorphus sp. 3E244]|uniref:tRNA (cytidine(34)-2'-O)-methyltransferase n=1 Tax=Tepidamorphus sp. 3E244 TaxID=3385498 RepID=UPI0038FC2B6E